MGGETTELEMQRREVLRRLERTLRELTATLLRTVRGAGDDVVAIQLADCVVAFAEFNEAYGYFPPHALLQEILNADEACEERRPSRSKASPEDAARWEEDGTFEREEAQELIRRGALQVTASMLLNERLQQRKGESDIEEGLRALEAAREKRRARALQPAAATKRSRAPAKRRPSKKAKSDQ